MKLGSLSEERSHCKRGAVVAVANSDTTRFRCRPMELTSTPAAIIYPALTYSCTGHHSRRKHRVFLVLRRKGAPNLNFANIVVVIEGSSYGVPFIKLYGFEVSSAARSARDIFVTLRFLHKSITSLFPEHQLAAKPGTQIRVHQENVPATGLTQFL